MFQALELCTDEEVVDVAGPRLSAAMSSWEYLLLRVQQEDEGNSTAPLIPRILNEVTSLMDRVSSMAVRHLQPHRSSGEGNEDQEPYQLVNTETARLVGLPCGTYYMSKDERKLLEEDAIGTTPLSDVVVVSTTSNVAPSVANVPELSVDPLEDDDAQMKTDPATAAASKLWEELEEAAHLPPTAGVDGEPGIGGGTDGDHVDDDAVDSELMQVDEIVNQVVEGQTGGSQAPSPL